MNKRITYKIRACVKSGYVAKSNLHERDDKRERQVAFRIREKE